MSGSFQDRIRARFEQGFGEWNQGYDAWLTWCDTLYEPDAYYNVNGQRLTLQQYKEMMGQLFGAFEIDLGDFQNMLVQGDWGAIRYTVTTTDKRTGEKSVQSTMEFVQFKDNPDPAGARVVEGWALAENPLSVR